MINPWIILAAFGLAGLFGWYEHHVGYEQAKLEMEMEVAKANEKSRQTESILTGKLNDQATELRKAQKHADKKIEKLKSALSSGSLRLSIPVTTESCVQAPASSASASGDSGQVRAELDKSTAQDLVSITADGDAAIRKHAACVDAYNQVREQLNAKP